MDRSVHNRGKIYRAQLETKIAGNDTRDVEQVVNESGLRARVTFNRFNCPPDIVFIDLTLAQQGGPAEHRSERRAQFMRKSGEKVVFEPISFLSMLTCLTLAHQQFSAFLFSP